LRVIRFENISVFPILQDANVMLLNRHFALIGKAPFFFFCRLMENAIVLKITANCNIW